MPFADAPGLPRDGDAPNAHFRAELEGRDTVQLPDVETAALTAIATATAFRRHPFGVGCGDG